MLLGIDHLIFAVPDPDGAATALATLVGTPAGEGGRHPAWGTRNRLLWFGDTFVELLGIDEPELASRSWLGGPATIALASRPALIGWAIATDDLDADIDGMQAHDAGLAPAARGERRRPDGSVVRWRSALPPTVNLGRPFLIWHDPAGAEWTPADRRARAGVPGRISELELPTDRLYGLSVGAHDHAVSLGEQRVRLTPDRRPTVQVTGLGFRAPTTLFGCRWSFDEVPGPSTRLP